MSDSSERKIRRKEKQKARQHVHAMKHKIDSIDRNLGVLHEENSKRITELSARVDTLVERVLQLENRSLPQHLQQAPPKPTDT